MHSHRVYAFPTQLARPPCHFYCLLKILAYLSSMDYTKFTSQTALFALLFQSVMVQLTISLPASSILSSPYLAIFHHIKDTKHFLNLIEKLPPFPSNSLLVTVGVTSLYTDIPHEEGIAAVIHSMEKQRHLLHPKTVHLPV